LLLSALFRARLIRALGAFRVEIKTMKKLGFVCLLLLLSSSVTFAQSHAHGCQVSITDFNTDDKTKLGSFTFDLKREKLIVKSYRFPDTELFVTASVFYKRASTYDAANLTDELILTLALGKKAYSVIESDMKNADMVTNARAIVPLKSFDEVEVETIYLGKPEAIIIALECKKK
jgi:hypothetical protein